MATETNYNENEMYTFLKIKEGVSLAYFPEQGVSLESLGIPSIHYKAHGHKKGNKCVCVACLMIKEGTDPKDKIMTDKVVGMVKDREDFGEIVFKDFFLEKYPVLKDYIVVRECPRVFVAYPKKQDVEQAQYNEVIGKRGRPRTPINSHTPKTIGPSIILSSIADQLGIPESLQKAGFRQSASNNIFSYIIYTALEGTDSLNLIPEKSEDNYYPGLNAVSKGGVHSVIKSIDYEQVNKFLDARTKLAIRDGEFINNKFMLFGTMDSTSITHTGKCSLAEYGHNKDGDKMPQINVMYACTGNKGIPIFYKTLQGNIPDVTSFKQCLEFMELTAIDFKKENNVDDLNILLALDRGFFSQSNIDCVLESEYIQALINVPSNHFYFKEAVAFLESKDIYSFNSDYFNLETELHGTSTTIDVTINKQTHKLYVYAYFNYFQANTDYNEMFRAALQLEARVKNGIELSDEDMKLINTGVVDVEYEEVNEDSVSSKKKSKSYSNSKAKSKAKSLIPTKVLIDKNKIKQRARENNTFVFVSTMELNVWDAYKYYKQRNNNEVAFYVFKHILKQNRIRTGKDKSVDGRMFISFNSTIIYQELLDRMRQAEHLIDTSNKVRKQLGEYGIRACKELLTSAPKLLNSFKTWKVTFLPHGPRLNELVGWKRVLLALLGISFEIPKGETIESINYEQYVLKQISDDYDFQQAYEDGLSVRQNR